MTDKELKITDLMVGDWVIFHESSKVSRKCIVRSIDKDSNLIVEWIDDDDIYSELTQDISPIPLTPEILEKNGFEESYYSILTADGYKKLPQYKYKNITQVQDICRNLITISYNDLKGGVYDIQYGIGSHIYDLKYVHQFQHALRLCGIEKEIEL